MTTVTMERPTLPVLTFKIPRAVAAVGISAQAYYRAAETPDGPPVLRIGRRLVVPVARLAEYLGCEPSDLLTAEERGEVAA